MSSRLSSRSAVLLCAAVTGLALLTQGLATAAPTTPTSHNAGYTFTLTATRLDGSALNTAPNYVTTNALVELYDRAGGGATWLRPDEDYTLTRINDTWTVSDLSANLLTISFSPGGAFIQGYIEVTGPNATIVRPSGPDQPIVDVSTPLSLTVTAPLSPALHGTITDPEGQGGEVPVWLSEPPGNGWLKETSIDLATVSSGRYRIQTDYWPWLTATPSVIGLNRENGYSLYAPSYYSSTPPYHVWSRSQATTVLLEPDKETEANLHQATCATVEVPLQGLPKGTPDPKSITSANMSLSLVVTTWQGSEIVARTNDYQLWKVDDGATLTTLFQPDGTFTGTVPGVAPGGYNVEASIDLDIKYKDGTTLKDTWQGFPGSSPDPSPTTPPLTVATCTNVRAPASTVKDFGLVGTAPPPTTSPTPPPTTASPPTTAPTLQLVTPPTISGTPRLGTRLTASPGTWSLPHVTHSFQWYRSDKPIPGATNATYTPTTDDVGKRLHVNVTARSGSQTTNAPSAKTAKVAKAVPKVTLKLTKKRVALGASGKATVRVKVPGLAKPVGRITIKLGSKRTTVTLKSKHRGKITVRLPVATTPGKTKVTATFKPTKTTKAAAKPATSKPTPLRIK